MSDLAAAVRHFFEAERVADAARDAYEHWSLIEDPGSDYRSLEQDRMCNTLADLCMCADERADAAEADLRRMAND